ncbi:MAG: type IV toxin-antitoxin system AbiEi family antitoxin domain-containing protein [Bacteriovoracaceae bacterium]
MNKKEHKKALAKIKKEKVFNLAELTELFGNRMEVCRKARAGIIQSLGSGYYASPKLDPFLATLRVVMKYYPEVVISGRTALHIHGLSQDYIEQIDVDIKREKSLRNKLLKVHRVPSSRYVGITQISYQGIKIKIYDTERTLAEAYRLDPAGPDFYKALKRYIKKGNIKSDQIAHNDKILKTKVMTHLQQELAND